MTVTHQYLAFFRRGDRKIIAALLLWLIFIALVLTSEWRNYSADETTSVARIYWETAEQWMAGEDIYGQGAYGFLYLPATTVLLVPFRLLPAVVFEVVARVVLGMVLAHATWRLTRMVSDRKRGTYFIFLSVAAILFGWAAFRLGQFSGLMLAFMVYGTVDLNNRHWWRTTLWLSAAVAVKPLAIVYVLLVGVLYPQMSWRLLIGFIAVLILPFFAQSPGYVLESYGAFFSKMSGISDSATEARHFRQIFRVTEKLGLELSSLTQWAIRLVAGAATLGLGYLAILKKNRVRATVTVLSLSVLYLLLFNPRTEGNTYVIFLPVTLFAAWALWEDRRKGEGIIVLILMVLLCLSYELAGGKDHVLKPALCLAVFCYVIFDIVMRGQDISTESADRS